MLITATSKDNLILSNMVSTLSQIKEAGKANAKLPIEYVCTPCDDFSFSSLTSDQFASMTLSEFASLSTESASGPTCDVSFYTDSERSNLLFSQNTTSNSSSFSTVATRTLYSPPDSLMNDSMGISTTMAQPIYWTTASFCDGTVKTGSYRNCDNLVFPTVRVATKGEPPFSDAASSCTIYPMGERIEIRKVSDTPNYIIQRYEISIAMAIYNWANLSEQQRVAAAMTTNNLLRNALYADRSRGGNCTFFNERIDGTFVSQLKVQPSPDMLKGVINVECCYVSAPTGY